jgi:hypothetical protein
MAVTSIWSVKGWLGKIIIYVENPEKTQNTDTIEGLEVMEEDVQGLKDVIAYAVNQEKTSGIADEAQAVMQQYVSGVNCTPSTARTEMAAVKNRFGKNGGIIAYHGYQSFAPGECTPVMAHEIGLKLAEEVWGKRFQVLVATHLDKAHHLHNHFVVNSVSFIDGLRYHRTNQDYRDMRKASDRLCREYKLSVIENPKTGKAKHYGEWRAEQEARPTYRGIVRADIDDSIKKSKTEKQFFRLMKEKGYTFKFGKDITVCPAGKERGLKMVRNFGEEYSIEAIRRRILFQTKARDTPNPIPDIVKRFVGQEKKCVLRLRGNYKHTRKIGGLKGRYLRYCYLLGILPKNRPPADYKKMHFLLREDLTKLDTISRETRLLCHYQIDTVEQLFSLQSNLQGQIEKLIEIRKHLSYKSRSIRSEDKRAEVKAEIYDLSKQIKNLRKEVALSSGIAARSGVIKDKIEIMRQENSKEKEGKSHEHIRRSR